MDEDDRGICRPAFPVGNSGGELDGRDPSGVSSIRAELPGCNDSASREFISVDDLAAELGVNRKTLYNAISQHRIPGVRPIGKRLVVHRPTVIEWLCSGRGAVPRSRRMP
jgi:excisionase family DNA binding protein